MRISVGVVVALALAMPCAAAPFAAAADSTPAGKVPTMIAPHAHQTLSGVFNAEASSSHARVEFMLDDFDDHVVLSAPTVGGTATAALPSWGFTGDVRVRARECDGSVCGDFRSSPSGLTVVNEPLAVVQPSVPVDLTAGENVVPVVVPSAGGWVKVSLDGDIALQADGGINAVLDFSHRPDGVYHPVARRCSPLDHKVCGEQADLPTIRVLRKLSPHGPSDPIPPISPNGDGVRDAAMREVTILPSWAPALASTPSGRCRTLTATRWRPGRSRSRLGREARHSASTRSARALRSTTATTDSGSTRARCSTAR